MLNRNRTLSRTATNPDAPTTGSHSCHAQSKLQCCLHTFDTSLCSALLRCQPLPRSQGIAVPKNQNCRLCSCDVNRRQQLFLAVYSVSILQRQYCNTIRPRPTTEVAYGSQLRRHDHHDYHWHNHHHRWMKSKLGYSPRDPTGIK